MMCRGRKIPWDTPYLKGQQQLATPPQHFAASSGTTTNPPRLMMRVNLSATAPQRQKLEKSLTSFLHNEMMQIL
jgi:hypothetical protein